MNTWSLVYEGFHPMEILSLKCVVDPIRIQYDGKAFELSSGQAIKIQLKDKAGSCDT